MPWMTLYLSRPTVDITTIMVQFTIWAAYSLHSQCVPEPWMVY